MHGWIEQKGYSLGQVMNTLRLALVGAGKGPGMYDVTKPPLRDPAEGASFASYQPSILLTGIRITVFSRDTAVRRGSFR